LQWLFPTPVLQVKLEPEPATAAAMLWQLEQFYAQVSQHPEFSDRNNLTGDLLGHAGLDQLHRMDAFQWLNRQLAEHVSAYLRSLLARITVLWPTSKRPGLWCVPGMAE
ncbi:MAG: TIGR02466 family protein, partial [Pseudomonadota bacterium]|nr:TIGR02466 family protein [Pseudomonadota bacterium]